MMHYSPKLKKAMQEIKDILHRHDIAGVVVLHTPGNSEYLIELSPSYSAAKIQSDGVYRIKMTKKEATEEQAYIKLKDTCNMFNMLGTTTLNTGNSLMKTSVELDKLAGADHGEEGHSTQTTQDN